MNKRIFLFFVFVSLSMIMGKLEAKKPFTEEDCEGNTFSSCVKDKLNIFDKRSKLISPRMYFRQLNIPTGFSLVVLVHNYSLPVW